MEKLTVIIIDDETNSRIALRQKLLAHCPQIEIVAECEDAESGLLAISEKKPHLVFLDVEMPRMNGFTMLQLVPVRDFALIFTTAYDHYAIQAIRVSALDYLVKPIEVSELKLAVEKAVQKQQQHHSDKRIETLLSNLLDEKRSHQRIAVPSMEGLQFLDIAEMIYLEAESNYTVIYRMNMPKLTISKTLKDFEDLLPTEIFIRIHHSYLINKNHVQKYLRGDGGHVVMKNGKVLDVSRRKKEEFVKAIGQGL